MDLEARQCTPVKNGSLDAESLWYGGRGCAANVGSSKRGRGLLKQRNAEDEASV